MKTTRLLTKQHDALCATLKRLRKGRGKTDVLLKKLTRDMSICIRIEQDLLYPHVAKSKRTGVLEGLEQHALMEFALGRLMHNAPSDPAFPVKASVLETLTRKHFQSEKKSVFRRFEARLGRDAKPLYKKMKKILQKVSPKKIGGVSDQSANGKSRKRAVE
jgi:Hemerythrin HHE cation binding domain